MLEIRKPHRSTVYLTTEHHSQIEEAGLNLSEFLREKLDEYFRSEKTIVEKINNLKLMLKRIKSEEKELKSKEKSIKSELKKFEGKIGEITRMNDDINKLGFSKKEYAYLLDLTGGLNGREASINDYKNYKENFNVNIDFSGFIKLLRKVVN